MSERNGQLVGDFFLNLLCTKKRMHCSQRAWGATMDDALTHPDIFPLHDALELPAAGHHRTERPRLRCFHSDRRFEPCGDPWQTLRHYPTAGWWEPNTLYTGLNQTYLPAGSTTRRPVDVLNPHYCVSPYTDTYYESPVFQYTNPQCVWLPEREMWQKATPSYMFVTTFYFDHRTSSMPCNDPVYGPRCNRNTQGVVIRGNTCLCKYTTTHYPVNPEGLINVMSYTFTVIPKRGLNYYGGNLGNGDILQGDTNNLGVTTYLRDTNDNDIKVYKPGEMVKLTVAQWLDLAGVTLDQRNPASSLSGHRNPKSLSNSYPQLASRRRGACISPRRSAGSEAASI